MRRSLPIILLAFGTCGIRQPFGIAPASWSRVYGSVRG